MLRYYHLTYLEAPIVRAVAISLSPGHRFFHLCARMVPQTSISKASTDRTAQRRVIAVWEMRSVFRPCPQSMVSNSMVNDRVLDLLTVGVVYVAPPQDARAVQRSKEQFRSYLKAARIPPRDPTKDGSRDPCAEGGARANGHTSGTEDT